MSPSSDIPYFSRLAGDPVLAAEFSTGGLVRRMLQVEGALATVQGRLGVIPAAAAARIAAAAGKMQPDEEQLLIAGESAGFPVIELVGQLRAELGAATEAAEYVHWGATTQDIMDTALVLQIRAALRHQAARLQALILDLARLAEHHRDSLMAGRTHAQYALPITFGLKVAGWLAPLLRYQERLAELQPRLLVVQFGGAAGTLAALGQHGLAVQAALAAELELGLPLMPWHTQRDGLGELAAWQSALTASLAKMAQDIILLAQSDVAEVREAEDRSRGGSSTMPQKSNPVVSELILSAARTNAALLAAIHQAMVQEHERGTHGWQVEWLVLPQMMPLTGGALQRALFLSRNLVVDEARMRRTVQSSQGLMLAEAMTFALAESMPRTVAKSLVTEACRRAVATNRHLVDVLREMTDAPVDWSGLRDEAVHLGATGVWVDRVVQQARRAAGDERPSG